MKKIITAIVISVFLAALVMLSPLASSPVLPSESDSDYPTIVSTLGTTVSGLGTQNLIEDNKVGETEVLEIEVEETEVKDTEVEDTEVLETEVENTEVLETEVENTEVEETEVKPEEPIGIEEMLANAFNCSEDVIFVADSVYDFIPKKYLMKFIEENDKNEEPRMPEIHDCDNFAMEFLMEIDAEFALYYKFVPVVGVIWVKDCDAGDNDDGHAVNFWMNSTDKSVWAFDPQTDEEYSLEDQIVTFVYM